MARKRGGIKIVWLAWFSDSIALWQRQDETPYLLDDPSHPISHGAGSQTSMTNASIGADGGIQSSEQHTRTDVDVGEDDWDQEPPDIKETGTLELGSINWDDINDEVEAAMNESDDEDGDDAKSEGHYDMQSGHISEGEWTDGNSGSFVSNIILCFPSYLITFCQECPQYPAIKQSQTAPKRDTGGRERGN